MPSQALWLHQGAIKMTNKLNSSYDSTNFNDTVTKVISGRDKDDK